MSVAAYTKANLASESATRTEYRLFAEITGELEKSKDPSQPPQNRINALFRNSQLWLTLEADLVSPENKLDVELKAGLISLAIWVKKFTSDAMKSKLDLEPLIDVNRKIMDGLLESEKNSRTSLQSSAIVEFEQLQA